jgi:hypothetical protein
LATPAFAIQGDAYTQAIAAHFGKDPQQIARLFTNGYGRSELITMIIISNSANIDLLNVVRMRKHGARFSAICAQMKIEWPLVEAQSQAVRAEIDNSVLSAKN